MKRVSGSTPGAARDRAAHDLGRVGEPAVLDVDEAVARGPRAVERAVARHPLGRAAGAHGQAVEAGAAALLDLEEEHVGPGEVPRGGGEVPPLGERDVLAGAAIDAGDAHGIGVVRKIALLPVDQPAAVGAVAGAAVVGGVARGDAHRLGRRLGGAGGERQGEDAGAHAGVRREGGVGGEGDLAAVGGDVELAVGIHQVEPALGAGDQVAHGAGLGVDEEEVVHLAVGEPAVPEAVDAVLGDVGAGLVLGALLAEAAGAVEVEHPPPAGSR